MHICKLSDYFEITSSKRVFKSEWTQDGIPFYRAREIVKISKNEKFKDPIFISNNHYQEVAKKYGVPKIGDLLVTGVGTLGISLIIENEKPFYFKDGNIRIAVGRAGNVIGGGDWAKDRIIPDIIRSLNNNEVLKIRSPKATRPWQHVLEPLSGYLTLAYNLSLSESIHGQAFNFGPPPRSDYNVEQVLSELKKYFQNLKWDIEENKNFQESQLLKLDCSKAKQILNWESSMSFKETIQFTSDWYNRFMENSSSMKQFSIDQIKHYSQFKEIRNKK